MAFLVGRRLLVHSHYTWLDCWGTAIAPYRHDGDDDDPSPWIDQGQNDPVLDDDGPGMGEGCRKEKYWRADLGGGLP